MLTKKVLNNVYCWSRPVPTAKVLELAVAGSGVATGGKRGNLPPPPTSDRTPREIDADQRRFSYPKKWGLVYRICSDVLHAPTLRWTFFGLTITKKEGVVEVVEGVTLVGLQ